MTMTTSAQGRALIAAREGMRLVAYKDSVGILTIGVGHTGRASPPIVTEGMTITSAQADAFLANDLITFERAVTNAVQVALAQNEFDALTSLALNIGGSALAGSTVMRKLNAGDRAGAADAFLMWNKAGGKVLAGLENRRQDERRQFLTPYPASVQTAAAPAAPYQQPTAPIPREPAVAAPRRTFGQWFADTFFARKA